jgi:hypothetical protein
VFGQPERLASCFCEEEGEKQLVSRGERAHNCRLSGQNGNPDSKTLKPTSACCPATGPWYTHRPTAGPAQHPSHHSGFVRCLAKKPGPRRTVERIKSDG